MLRCKIDVLELVSKLRVIGMPTISRDILGVLCSNVTEP